jgi:parallel beta-helix repeat protein
VVGAKHFGIFLKNALDSTVSNCFVAEGQKHGIGILDSSCIVKDNQLINNHKMGLMNRSGENCQVFHNFAQKNGKNYSGVPYTLITAPKPGVGALENISI